MTSQPQPLILAHANFSDAPPALLLLAQDGGEVLGGGSGGGQTGEGAPAQGAQGQGGAQGPPPGAPPPGGGMSQIIFLLLPALLIFLIVSQVMSSRKEKKRREEMLGSLGKSDRVQTVGGVIGTIVELKSDRVVLRTHESSNTRITVAKSAIQQILKHGRGGSGADEPEGEEAEDYSEQEQPAGA